MNRHSRFKTFITTILLCGGGLAILAGLVSCENFLKAGQVKDEILEAIEIANSTPVTVNIIADEGSGTVTPSQLRMKRKETFEVFFNVSEGWRFIKWEVYDRNTGEPVTDAIKFDDETALETKGTMLVAKENLVIHPKAYIVPIIQNVRPSSSNSNFANTPIVVQFNVPMEESNVTYDKSIFNYDNINITCNGNPMAGYFNPPVFNVDKTILTITPKASELIEYINKQSGSNIELKVTFSELLKMNRGGVQLALEQNEYSSFTIRYNANIETNPPLEQEFLITSKLITLDDVASVEASEKFIIATNISTEAQILQNRNNGTIYIFGEYSDDESGIGSIHVIEQRINGKDGFSVSDGPVESIFDYSTTQNASFETISQNTRFIIKYTMKDSDTGDHKDGAIRLKITVYDNSGNPAPTKTLTVIKDSFIDLSNVELYNFNKTAYAPSEEAVNQGDYIAGYHNSPSYSPGRYSTFREEFYEQNLKVVKLQPLNRRVYGDVYMPESDFTITVDYIGNSGPRTDNMTYDSDKKKWILPLQVDNIANLALKLTVKDSMGFVQTKDFAYPPDPETHITYNEYNYPEGYLYIAKNQPITAYTEFAFTEWVDDWVPEDFYFFSTTELSKNYPDSTIIPNGESSGVWYIYQNGSLWGNKNEQWFSWIRFEKDTSMTPPTILSAVKQRSELEGYVDIKVTIPASTWDTDEYDSIAVLFMHTNPTPSYGTVASNLETSARDMYGLINRGSTSAVITTKFFDDAPNWYYYVLVRGLKNGKWSKISNYIWVEGLNNESEEVQHSLLNFKPILYPREDFYNLIKNNTIYEFKGLYHGTDGDNTIHYKNLPAAVDYFYPLSVELPYTQRCGYSPNFSLDYYDGDKVIVKINGVTNTYNFSDVAYMIKPDTGDPEEDIKKEETHYQLIVPLTEMCYENNELSITVTTNCGTSATYNTRWVRGFVPKFNDFSGTYLRSEKNVSNSY